MAVLTAIAIPNYLKYTRNAKTAEAQSSLGQVYMAEKSFYLQWRFYTVDLVVAGVAPDGSLLYNAGFTGAGATVPATYQGPSINTANNTLYKICGKTFGAGTVENCAFRVKKGSTDEGFQPPGIATTACDNTATFCHNQSFDASATAFIAGAVADIISKVPSSTATRKDIWCINQYKQIARCKDGS